MKNVVNNWIYFLTVRYKKLPLYLHTIILWIEKINSEHMVIVILTSRPLTGCKICMDTLTKWLPDKFNAFNWPNGTNNSYGITPISAIDNVFRLCKIWTNQWWMRVKKKRKDKKKNGAKWLMLLICKWPKFRPSDDNDQRCLKVAQIGI